MNVLWCEMCISTPEQKQKTLWRCWPRLVRECHHPQWNEYCTDMGWKVTQRGGSHYSKSNRKKPDYSLEMHTGTKILIFRDMSCGLMKLKLNCLAIMTIVTFRGRRAKLVSLRTPSQLWSIGLAASCCLGCFEQFESESEFERGTGAYHKKDGIMRKEQYVENWSNISRHQPGS